jgi:pterin-4a-carbinolamine dehydratase
MIKNQLTGKTTKAHAEQIRLASLEWKIPKQAHKLNLRNPTMAVPVETDSDITSSSESNDHTPLAKIDFSNVKLELASDFSSLDWLLLILSLLSLLFKLDMVSLVCF